MKARVVGRAGTWIAAAWAGLMLVFALRLTLVAVLAWRLSRPAV